MQWVLVDRKAGILLQQADFSRVFLLHLFEGAAHVVASSSVVQVGGLIDVFNVPAGHLQHREDKGLIASRQEELPVLIPQVLLPDLEEQLGAEGAQVPKLLNDFAVVLLLDGELGVSFGISLGDVLLIIGVVDVVGVGEAWIFGLVDSVEELEDMAADELVVAVHFEGDGVIFTVVVNCVVEIGQRALSFLPLDHDCPFLGNCSSPEVALNEHSRLVIRVIVDDYHQVIAVVLVEDGLQVVDVAVLLHVIPGRNHHAHRDLIVVLIDIVLALIRLVLSLNQILHLLCVVASFLEVVVWILDVVEGQAELSCVLVVFLAEALDGEVAVDDLVRF